VIDVRDDREIPYQLRWYRHFWLPASDVEGKLSGKMTLFPIEHQVDSLADVFRDWDLGFLVEQFELLILFRREVHGRGNLSPWHDETMHDHTPTVNRLKRHAINY
jgi:hypothetical protein